MSLGWSDKSNIYSNFSLELRTQLDARKEIVSTRVGRTDSQLQFLNSNTGWVKLSSGVKEKAKNSKLDAEENVLFGGVYNSKDKKAKDGIFSGKNSSYTFSKDLGFRPMAGILNADIKSQGTFGAIKKATIEFQLNSLEELDKFEKLYMLPGYSVLLEWGHTMILDNKGKLNTVMASSYNKWFIDTPAGNDKDGIHRSKIILEAIEAARGEKFFNYDALFGKISNYIWSFNADGTYSCSIDIVGYGELAESMSALFTPMPNEKEEKLTGEGSTNLFNIYLESILNLFPATSGNRLIADTYDEINNPSAAGRSEDIETQRGTVGNYVILSIDNSKAAEGATTSSASKYITLGSLINLVNLCFCLKDDGKQIYNFYTGRHNPVDKKIRKTEYKNVSPFITFDEHISSNIDVCFLPKSENRDRKFNITFASTSQVDRTIHGDNNDVLNILVNVVFAKNTYANLLENNKNADINGYDYIKTILDNISKSLGNINNFSIEARDQLYFIADRATVPGRGEIKYNFDLFGLKSLATEISLQSSIPSNLSTMIAIGASAGNSTLNENVFNFQSFYKSFIDRIVPQRQLDKDAKNSEDFIDSTKEDNKKLKKNVKTIGTYIRTLNKDRTISNISIEELVPSHQVITNLLLKRELLKADTNAPGVVPISLSFKIMGISGLRITDVFNVSKGLLPERYFDNVGFTVTGIDNSISNNKWTTNVTAQMIVTTPLKEVLKSDFEIDNILDSIDDVFPDEILLKGFPHAAKVRKYIPTTGELFREKGTELTSAGMDITPQAAEFAKQLMARIFTKINGESQLQEIVRESQNQLFQDQFGRIESPRQLGPTVQNSLRFRWTGGNDSFHLYNPKDGNTLHRFGKALDLAIQQTHTPEQLKLATKIVSEASAELMGNYPHYYKDEYADESDHATEGHFHFEFGGLSIQDINEEKLLDTKEISLNELSSNALNKGFM